jgi:formylglycine-generating enzyme required for sulfatase activity
MRKKLHEAKSPMNNQLNFEWITIEAGIFWKGIAEVEARSLSDTYQSRVFLLETPRRQIAVPEFVISKYPVTNRQFRLYLQATQQRTSAHSFLDTKFADEDQLDLPVRSLSLYDALKFCQWAGCRLPTEVEWEKAASGPDGQKYPWGNEWNPERCNSADIGTEEIAYRKPEQQKITSVYQYPEGASPYGVMDMAGNVMELTSSTLTSDIRTVVHLGFNRPGWWEFLENNKTAHHYTGYDYLSNGIYLDQPVLKGGDFTSNRLSLRCSFRFVKHFAYEPGDLIGFRCVRL